MSGRTNDEPQAFPGLDESYNALYIQIGSPAAFGAAIRKIDMTFLRSNLGPYPARHSYLSIVLLAYLPPEHGS
ncbi:hypothetical protein [Arthrobacter sp. SAFR-014]|uniref:hypothetical protein n=1 Tax=unclassified Arthrobacter TaxID=235627 RepID=UPI003F7BC9A9